MCAFSDFLYGFFCSTNKFSNLSIRNLWMMFYNPCNCIWFISAPCYRNISRTFGASGWLRQIRLALYEFFGYILLTSADFIFAELPVYYGVIALDTNGNFTICNCLNFQNVKVTKITNRSKLKPVLSISQTAVALGMSNCVIKISFYIQVDNLSLTLFYKK